MKPTHFLCTPIYRLPIALGVFVGLAVVWPSAAAKADVRTFTAKPGQVIVTTLVDTEVQLQPASDQQITLEADSFDNVQINDSSAILEIRLKEPEKRHGPSRLTILAPAGTEQRTTVVNGSIRAQQMTKRLKLTTVNGDIDILKCPGPLTIEAVNGNIRLNQISDSAAVKVVSGEVNGDQLGGSFLEIKSVSGEIRLRNVNSKRVSINSMSGDVTLQGDFPTDGTVSLNLQSGDVTLQLAKANCDVSINSFSGSIRSDFAIAQVGSSYRSRMSGRIGLGGTDISINTFSGDVHLKK